jgi:hypothetical protein
MEVIFKRDNRVLETGEVAFFVTGLETLQILGVEMSTKYLIVKLFVLRPSCRPRLRVGLQISGLSKKDSLLLLMT